MALMIGHYLVMGWQPWEIAQKVGLPLAEVEAIIARSKQQRRAETGAEAAARIRAEIAEYGHPDWGPGPFLGQVVDHVDDQDRPARGRGGNGTSNGNGHSDPHSDPTPAPAAAPATAGLATIRAATVTPERVTWLWPGRIPAGKLAVLDGDPGLGKSTITLDVAARLTTGSPLPDGHRPEHAIKVALLGAEDGIADTIVPRLAAAGADLDAVDIVDHVTDEHGPRPVELPADLDRLEAFIGESGIELVIVDPLMAFLGGGVDAHRDQDVRRVLHRLKLTAEATGAAVVPVRHLNKAPGGNPLYRGGGSIGIVGAARAGLLVAPDPHDPGGQRRVLAATKSNLAVLPASLAYRVVEDEAYGVARIAWEGAVELSAADLLGGPVVEHASPKRDRAQELLRELLADGARLREELLNRAEQEFISEATLKRAAEELGVTVERRPEKGRRGRGPTWWSLPQAPPNTAHGDDGQLSMDMEADTQVRESNTDQPNTDQPTVTTGELYSSETKPQVNGSQPATERIQLNSSRTVEDSAQPARPRRIQIRRKPGWRLPPDAIRVDHGGKKPMRKYANRYDWREYGRPHAVELYREHQLPEVADDAPADLGGHDLACWCPPDEPCHADVLIEAANPTTTETTT